MTTTQFQVGDRVQVDGACTAHPYALGKVIGFHQDGKIVVEIPTHQISRWGRGMPGPPNRWPFAPEWLKLVK